MSKAEASGTAAFIKRQSLQRKSGTARGSVNSATGCESEKPPQAALAIIRS